jgi:hypothetical protein
MKGAPEDSCGHGRWRYQLDEVQMFVTLQTRSKLEVNRYVKSGYTVDDEIKRDENNRGDDSLMCAFVYRLSVSVPTNFFSP